MRYTLVEKYPRQRAWGVKLKDFMRDELRCFLQDLNFKSLEKSLLDSKADSKADVGNAALTSEPTTDLLKSEIIIKPWVAEEIQSRLQAQEKFFIFALAENIGIGFLNQLYVTEKSNCLLNFKDVTWSGFNLKNVWHEIGFKVNQKDQAQLQNRIDWDLMLGAYVIRAADSSNIKKLASYFLNLDLEENFSMEKMYDVCCKLNSTVLNQLEEKKLLIIYKKLEKPIIPILFAMEQKGISIDVHELHNYSEQLAKEIAEQEKIIYQLAGDKFNIASPKQLGTVLFEKLGLEAVKKIKTGFSTDNDVLEKLAHPIGKEIINYRELAKLKSTYVDALPQSVDAAGRIHTSFNQALTSTGRLSSTNPNIQNIPIKTERGQRVRKSFIAAPGKQLLSLDYSQIELRVLAHMSDDPGLIKAFQSDLDIHTATASEIFSVSLEQVTKEQRRIAKAVNFGIAYGQGVYGLAETLDIPRKH